MKYAIGVFASLLLAGVAAACDDCATVQQAQVAVPSALALAQGAALQSNVVAACGVRSRTTVKTRTPLLGRRRVCATSAVVAPVVGTVGLSTVAVAPIAQQVIVTQPQVAVQPNVVVQPQVVQQPAPSDVVMPERQFIQQPQVQASQGQVFAQQQFAVAQPQVFAAAPVYSYAAVPAFNTLSLGTAAIGTTLVGVPANVVVSQRGFLRSRPTVIRQSTVIRN